MTSADAHAKNYALLLSEGAWRLAPAALAGCARAAGDKPAGASFRSSFFSVRHGKCLILKNDGLGPTQLFSHGRFSCDTKKAGERARAASQRGSWAARAAPSRVAGAP